MTEWIRTKNTCQVYAIGNRNLVNITTCEGEGVADETFGLKQTTQLMNTFSKVICTFLTILH